MCEFAGEGWEDLQLSRLMIKPLALFFTKAMQLSIPGSLKDRQGEGEIKKNKEILAS